jgi:hypothetical protein
LKRMACMTLFLAATAAGACPKPPAAIATDPGFADPSRHVVVERGMWAIWYDPAFFATSDANATLEGLERARCAALTGAGMVWPSNLAAGLRFNVYLHVPGQNDGFGGYGWENGVGGNARNQPFMTLPRGPHADPLNLYHEGFHVFQWEATSPGFRNEGDAGWYIEATAQWFSARLLPDHIDNYPTASAIAGTPHLSLWHGFYNAQPQDPAHWMTETRQYGMHLFLIYLAQQTGLHDTTITSGFFDGTNLSPQEYLARSVGPDVMAKVWADFAALMTASFAGGSASPMPDWVLSPTQRDAAIAERARVMQDDPNPLVENDIAMTIAVGSDWVSPPDRLYPRPWSYNVIAISEPKGAAVLRLDSAALGPFHARLVTLRDGAWQIQPVATGGTIQLSGAQAAYLVLAWTPPTYGGAAPAPYRIRLDPA